MDEPGRHPASARKRRRLRLAGDLVPVGDLCSAGTLVVAGALLVLGGAAALGRLGAVMGALLRDPGPGGIEAALPALRALAGGATGGLLALALVPPALAWWARGMPWALEGGGLSGGPLPRLRVGRAAGALAKGGVTLVLVAALLPRVARALVAAGSPEALLVQAGRGVGAAFLAVAGLCVVTSALAHGAERILYERRIAMTDAERRREIEEDQGGPATRQARDRARERLLSRPVPATQAAPRERVGELAHPGGGEA